MANEEILRQWQCGELTCVLWRHDAVTIKGGLMRNGTGIATADILANVGEDQAARVLEAMADATLQPKPPLGSLDKAPFVDYIMVATPGNLRENEIQPLTQSFALADDLIVHPMGFEYAPMIYAACDPPGMNRPESIDLRGRPLYAFARANPPRNPAWQWDSDQRLQVCIALSRLVRPTSISMRYAVRIIGDVAAGRCTIMPGPIRSLLASAWTSDPDNDFLRKEDLIELRALIARHDQEPLPPKSRPGRAFWYFEYASLSELVDMRLPYVSTALETLLSSTGDRSTQQFVNRLPLLANALGLPAISNSRARKMWGLRSALVHGERHGGLEQKHFALYREMEAVLRLAIRRCISDSAFRAQFDSAGTIDAAFPMPASTGKLLTCPACSLKFEQLPEASPTPTS